MSRGYRIRLFEASSVAESEDQFGMDLALLDILPAQDMVALVREELGKAGWRKTKDGGMTTTIEGASVKLEPDGSKITVQTRETRRVTARAASQSSAKAKAETTASAAKDDLAQKVTKKLMRVEPAIREQVQKVLQKVYIEALQQKAQTLGEVESIDERRDQNGELELTIKIKV
ncbi:MAG: hypothetical protein ACPG4T_07065 [Nannocystaceae bacterium]